MFSKWAIAASRGQTSRRVGRSASTISCRSGVSAAASVVSTGASAAGSAGVSVPQSRFAGSDRQGRGRLVEALRRGEVPSSELASVVGWTDEPERLDRVVAAVVAEGLAVWTTAGTLRLP